MSSHCLVDSEAYTSWSEASWEEEQRASQRTGVVAAQNCHPCPAAWLRIWTSTQEPGHGTFLVGAHAQVAGLVLRRGRAGGSDGCFYLITEMRSPPCCCGRCFMVERSWANIFSSAPLWCSRGEMRQTLQENCIESKAKPSQESPDSIFLLPHWSWGKENADSRRLKYRFYCVQSQHTVMILTASNTCWMFSGCLEWCSVHVMNK